MTIPKPTLLWDLQLEATLFRPDGPGPFPLVVINHGKAHGNPRFQARARYSAASRALVQEGFAVLLPMRSGFSKSGGSYIDGGCNIEGNGERQADDVAVALDFARSLPYIDAHHIVVMGQSHGGLATLAFGTRAYPGVLGLVNFAGGLREDTCSGWQGALVSAFAAYGKQARYPSLWFYGENDSYWTPALIQEMYEAYAAAAPGRATLVDIGVFGTNSHAMFDSAAGVPIWLPRFLAFYASLIAQEHATLDQPGAR